VTGSLPGGVYGLHRCCFVFSFAIVFACILFGAWGGSLETGLGYSHFVVVHAGVNYCFIITVSYGILHILVHHASHEFFS